jgi:Pentapeptide repeats (8 copies)
MRSRRNQTKRTLLKIGSWLVKPEGLFLSILAVVILSSLISPKFRDWIGISESTEKGASITTEKSTSDRKGTITKITVTDRRESGKTPWDVFSLIIVPLSLTAFAGWIQSRQNQQTEENQREEALRDYIDSISDVLLDKKLFALKKDIPLEKAIQDSALDVIRARTLSILRRLNGDGKRKASVLMFLHDAQLITNPELHVVLHFADFTGADLSGASLPTAILDGVVLNHANLRNAVLINANLMDAKFHYADLKDATLSGARLTRTEFLGAKLAGAMIIETDIEATLSEAKLCNTELPKKWGLKRDRDCNQIQ